MATRRIPYEDQLVAKGYSRDRARAESIANEQTMQAKRRNQHGANKERARNAVSDEQRRRYTAAVLAEAFNGTKNASSMKKAYPNKKR